MTRIAAVLLLLINAVLLFWLYSRHVEQITADHVTRPPLPADAPSLVLLREMAALPASKDPQPVPETPSFDAVGDNAIAADRCLEVGPFGNIADSKPARDWLRDYVAAMTTRVESERQRQFFWIYLEPASEDAAQANLDSLAERGVTDYMLVRRGDLRNAISLGLFRSQDSVNRRLAELSEKGYKPVVVPRFEMIERYWVSVQLAEDYSEELDVPASLLGDAGVSEIPCTAR